ncbi:MAG: hypothetical protein HY595_00685 [Candidatus Omnitrophica bacterium]|nr:hypothetical protein [Candidatus Omnitrophota bacterium]
MRLLVLTSNALRHKFVANTLARHADDTLVVSECQPSDEDRRGAGLSPRLQAHFRLRQETEQAWFTGHETFLSATLPILYRDVNLPSTCRVVEAFRPDLCVVFGASLIRLSLLSRLPAGRTVNLHLGLSPYARGSGTNFWPFVDGELEYVGATLLHLDEGVDTGPIIAHVRPGIRAGDTVHTAGCRVIAASAEALRREVRLVRTGQRLPQVPQWPVTNGRYYRDADFTEEVLARYLRHLEQEVVGRFLSRPETPLRLISLPLEEAEIPERRLEVSPS